MLCVGMPVLTLCVSCIRQDAERRRRHSNGDRRNELVIAANYADYAHEDLFGAKQKVDVMVSVSDVWFDRSNDDAV